MLCEVEYEEHYELIDQIESVQRMFLNFEPYTLKIDHQAHEYSPAVLHQLEYLLQSTEYLKLI